MTLPNLTPARLLAAARLVIERAPDAELEKNRVGNLSIMRDGEWSGWINLRTGEVHFNEDEE